MRVLVTSTWGIGHVFPLVTLARAFRDAGHEVLWAAPEPACPWVVAAGLRAQPCGLDSAGVRRTTGRLAEALRDVAGPDRAAFAFPHMFGGWATPAMAADLLPLAREFRPDLVLHEPAELAAPLVAAVLGVRCVTHSWGGAVPAAFLRAAGAQVAPLWQVQGLEVPDCAGSGTGTYLDVCPPSVQTVALDHVGDRLPMRPGCYSGEPVEDVAVPEVGPLVYVTLGTVRVDGGVLRDAVTAVRAAGARALVTVGPGVDPALLGPLPDGVVVVPFLPQAQVLPHAAAVVSHAGSGTFLGALAAGLPQVCVPQAADQFRNAAGAEQAGVGLVLREPTVDSLTAAVSTVLSEPGCRRAAEQVAEELRALPDPADLVAVLAG